MKKLYETVVVSHGGRQGHVKSEDGYLDLAVSIPKEMGGPGGATNPEQLFAAGYAACFENALIYSARAKKISIGATKVTAKVAIGPKSDGGFQLAVNLKVAVSGLDTASAKNLVEEAHKVCPYSNATRGNIDVIIELE